MSPTAQTITPAAKSPLQAYLVIAMGVAAVSLGAIFIRLAQQDGIPSLFIAAARLSIAALILTPFTLRRHRPEIRKLSRSDLRFAILAGFFLAIHFATWILSLEHTSVLISVVLVSTSPLWVALLEFFFLRAHLGKIIMAGLIISLIGGVIVGLPAGDVKLGSNPLLGSLLAICGAMAVAAYYVIGRKLRARMSLLPYIWLVYSCAALILLAVVLIMGIPIGGYPSSGYLWLVSMALIPQLIGHTSYNYALRFLPATYISIAGQLEPVLSALIAYFIFHEVPFIAQILGSAVILTGVMLASLGQARSG